MILYEATETQFSSQGLGPLDEDVLDAFATVEINGVNELEITYSAHGRRFSELEKQRIITSENQDGGSAQPYRIYKITKPLNGRVRINCQHLAYDIIGFPVVPFTATGIAAALSGLQSHCLIPNNFNIVPVSVENTSSEYRQTQVKNMMDCLKGTKGSILDTFHGSGMVFDFDGWNIKVYSKLGSDKGVTIRYGHNMTDLKAIDDGTAVYTGAIAFWKTNDGSEHVYGDIAYSSNSEAFPVQKIFTLDASSDFQEQPTVEQLTERAAQYVSANGFGIPKVTIEASFVNLADSPEYAYLKNLTRVKLGDTVRVIHEDYGIEYEAEVIKTVWDVKKRRYKSITIGTKKGSMGSLRQAATQALEEQVQQLESALDRAIRNGTEKIRGGLGGYVVINTNADGEPNEILIMDSPEISTAVNVIRLNKEGIGFSQNGYDGDYRTAWTIDGEFYAENITAGILEGALLRAGSVETASLNVDAQSVVNGYITHIQTDSEGLHISQIDPESKRIIGDYQALFSKDGMRVIDNRTNTASLIAEGDSVTAENFTANNFLIINAGDYKARFQEFSNTEDSKQMGCFWID